MKIFFTASTLGRKKYLSSYETIVDLIKDLGHTIIGDHIVKSKVAEKSLTDTTELRSFYTSVEKWIHNADAIVAEISFPSVSVGYEVSLALHAGKPVLLVYSEGEPPSLLSQHKDDKLICEHYTNESIRTILEDFFSYASGTHDSRFTFFLNSEQAAHLENASKKKSVPKSAYLRNLIDEDRLKEDF